MEELLSKIVKDDVIVTYDVREYFERKVIAYTTKNSNKYYSSFPWCFAVEHKGKIQNFYGIPNYVETKAKALKRGWYRAKWMHDGTWNNHYRSWK